jgi:hypothetical protein
VYIISQPCSLQRARKGGSLTSSIGARNKGKSPKFKLPIFIPFLFSAAKIQSLGDIPRNCRKDGEKMMPIQRKIYSFNKLN